MTCSKSALPKSPLRGIKISLAVALLTSLIGCASKLSDTVEPSAAPQPEPSYGQLEEVVVTGTRQSTSSRNEAPRSVAVESALPHPQDAEIITTNRSDSNLPVLRKDSSYQIYKNYGVNPTISTATEQYSTFAMDVDTVSYQLAKANLKANQLPSKASIRVEEFVNNFAYDYGTTDDVFSVSAEVVPSPYRPGFHLLHIGVKAKHIPDAQRLPANIVLLADVSGSMNGDDKMGLQKQALTALVSQLSPKDSVAIVTYSQSTTVLLPPTRANKKKTVYAAIQKMSAGGGTNVEQGLMRGYKVAAKMAYPGHVNRVVLTSDGLANIGNVDPSAILKQVEDYKRRNIFLTTVGVGQSMYNDYLLEQLANKGNGNYLYLANQSDIERVFVDGLTSQLQAVAKDAKIQLQFNPKRVSLFRQIGYENRSLQTEDFLDASKDGGEVGANQQVTALYEIKLTGQSTDAELANVALSYKKPQGSKVFSFTKSIPSSVLRTTTDHASPDTLLSMSVAAFAEKLRQSYWSRSYDYLHIQSQLSRLPSQLRDSLQLKELQDLVSQASIIDSRRDPYNKELPISRIDYDRVPLLR
ncbi:VWA domain-containing protein [Arenicella sp. 4NH20-0111]|uniref:vWA domain-containing protein n=1 Tax=Arenicella sp. 4NH20-0111 TaxID=3127648 RepID=UPI00310530F0